MRFILASLAALALVSPAFAQDEAPPSQCRPSAALQIDYQACLAASPPGSSWRTLALINLGSDAVLRHDYASAVRYYDEARPEAGQQMYSDVVFHALRASAYWHVERREQALADAQITLRMLQGDPTLRVSPSDYMPAGVDRDTLYAFILPVLQSGDRAQFESALATYQALPASDWYSYANRAAVFNQLGQHDVAVAASERALQMAPNDPGVLNNHCAILVDANRAQEGLAYCERAVAAVPEVAAARDSLSDALAALGRCADAEREIAEARRLDPVSPNYARPIVCTPA